MMDLINENGEFIEALNLHVGNIISSHFEDGNMVVTYLVDYKGTPMNYRSAMKVRSQYGDNNLTEDFNEVKTVVFKNPNKEIKETI